jgi:2-hydroxychromene-2-carboxylate isomerase
MTTRSQERTTRAAAKEVPQRSEEFAHLTLKALREQRRTLGDEENRVSYWRRLIQARMDLIELSGGDDSVRLGRLRTALAETRVGNGRGALVDIMPIDDVPPLPDLAGLWAREADPDDPSSVKALKRDLSFAELQLSAYRAALHRRLAGTTGELIARYREDPRLALTALPIPQDELI